jgi:hypothetical protein
MSGLALQKTQVFQRTNVNAEIFFPDLGRFINNVNVLARRDEFHHSCDYCINLILLIFAA